MSGGSWQQDLFSLLRLRRLGTILFLVAIWYYFSYEYNTRLKAWLSDSKTHHATLDTQGVTTTAQQLAAAATTWLSPVTMPLLIAIFLSTTVATMPWVLHAYAVTPELLPAWKYLWTHHTLDMGLMCASTVMGTSTITVVYEYGSIQLVQVARSVGPLFTTVWAVLLLDQVTKDKPLACLFASLAGTLLASWKEPTLCMMTVVLMLAANSCMTFRNAITRRLLGHLGISHHHHAAPKQVEHNHGARSSPQRAFSDPYQPDFSSIPATHMASWLLTTGNAAGCATLMVLLLVGGMSGARAMVELYNMPFSSVSRLMVLGGTNWAYNLASQLVLAQLTVVSHGMLELLKRVFVLVAVSFFSQKANWQWHNVAGAVITFVAAAFYFHYSHAAPSTPKAPHPSHSDTKVQPSDSTAADSKSASSGVVVFLQSVTGAHRSDVIQSPTRRDQGKEKLLSSAGSSGGGALIDGSAVISVTYPGQSDKDANAAGYQEPPPGHAAVQAFSPRRSWLPPAGPRRVSLARTAIIAIMLCSVPLLMPSDFWGFLSADGMGGSRIQLVTQHTSAFQPPGQWVQASAPHVTVPGSDSGAVKLTPSTNPDTAADDKDRRSLGRTDKQTASVQAGRGERGGRERGRARAGGKGKGSGGNRAHMGLQAKIPGSAGTSAATTSTGAATSGTRLATNGTQQRTLKGLYDSALYGIYLGWLGHDNLGDDIVADIFYELLRQSIQSQAPEGAVVQVTKDLDPQLSWKLPGCGRAKAYDQCHFAVIGGGSTVDVPFIMAARDMLAAKRPVLLFGGGYQRVYHNAELQKTSLELLMGAGTLGGIRGPITESFLLNRTQSTLPIIGDSGFLSDALFPGSGLTIASQLPAKIMPGQPIPHWPPAPECMTANRPVHTRDNQVTKSMHAPLPSEAPGSLCERPLVVATLRTDLVSSDLNKDLKFLNSDTDIEQLKVPRHPIAIMMLMIEELVNEHHFQVVLQAVDDKSLMAHERYIDMINRRIKPGNPLVVLHNEHADYNQVMELYERAAVTVNCRLHSGVLAAAALRPTIYMASLPKFADFMASIQQDEYMVKPDRPEMASLGSTELAKLLVSKVLSATNNAAAISSKLQTIRDDMLKKYKEAMRTLMDRLATDHPVKFKSVIQDCSSISIKRSTCLSERTVIYIQCLNSANMPSTGQQSIQY